jgi:hypothetical protein
VDEELAERFSDLVYEVELKGKGKIFVYLLFEHKSYEDPEVGLYLLLLMVRIWLNYRKQKKTGLLPPVLPLVVYHGKTKWKIKTEFQTLMDLPDVMGPYVPGFEYLICDLSRYSDEDIKGNVLLRVTFLLLKHIFSEKLGKMLPEFLGLLEGLSDRRTALQFLEASLRYLSSGSTHVSREELIDTLKEICMDEKGVLMATLAEEWIEEGIQKGSMKVLVRLAAKRFQVRPDLVSSMLNGLKNEEIEDLAERFLDAESLDQIYKWAEEKRVARKQ